MGKSRSETLRDIIPSELVLTLSPDDPEESEGSRIQKRTIRSVRLGEFPVHYETSNGSGGKRTVPEELNVLCAPEMNYAYDTILFVTVLRYVQLMQREEIQAHIKREHFFHISTGSISELSLMGLAYLERCHFAKAQKLADMYRERGCYFIHMDGTNEGGMYTHFVVRDGMSGNVLYADKIISENEIYITPLLEKVKAFFGNPSIVISDMSPAIKNAVEAVFKGVPHKLCHYHFLKAVGITLMLEEHKPVMISVKRLKDILNEQRKELEKEFKQNKKGATEKKNKNHDDCQWLISMIDYINDYEKDLSGEGFPFDVPALAFYYRCNEVFQLMEEIMDHGKRLGKDIDLTLGFIRNRIQEFLIYSKINQLENLNDIFMELRDILHPKTEKEHAPLNWGMTGADLQIEDVGKRLDKLWEKAEKKAKSKLTKYLSKAWKTIRNQLRKRRRQLDPVIEIDGKIFILPRTNNMSETGFRDVKRKARRTTGMKNLSKYMDNLPPQYFYTFNLQDIEYVKSVYGDGEIYDSFHTVDKDQVRKDVEKMKALRMSPKAIDYKLVRSDNYLERLANHFVKDSDKAGNLKQKNVA